MNEGSFNVNDELGTVVDCSGIQCKRRLRDVPSLD